MNLKEFYEYQTLHAKLYCGYDLRKEMLKNGRTRTEIIFDLNTTKTRYEELHKRLMREGVQ